MLFLDANTISHYLHDVKPFSQIVEDIVSEEDEPACRHYGINKILTFDEDF